MFLLPASEHVGEAHTIVNPHPASTPFARVFAPMKATDNPEATLGFTIDSAPEEDALALPFLRDEFRVLE